VLIIKARRYFEHSNQYQWKGNDKCI